MRFRIRMIRGDGPSREQVFEEFEAEGATLAYCAAMKAHNSSEGWTPVGWEVVDGKEGSDGKRG